MTAEVTLYTRQACGLCDETASELRRLGAGMGFSIVEVDVDADAMLREQYNDIVPVVAVGERVIAHAPVDLGTLGADLAAALR